jgi:SAM-dependent methyltransferase
VQQKCLVEIGCGVGNTLLPLLEDDRGGGGGGDDARNKGGKWRDRIQWTVHGWDVSSVAIDHLRRDGRFRRAAARGRAHAHVCDVSSGSGVPPCVCAREAADVTTLLFCLSAVDPDHHGAAARRAAGTLKPGGVLVFRDYGRFDRAQFQLARQRNKLVGQVASDSGGTSPCYFYRKHDGTHCLYFSVEYVRELFAEVAGLEELDCRYLERRYTNRSQGAVRRRVWVQARFRKPANGTVRPSMDTWQVPMKAP